jgi:hypothetical protein
MSDKSTSKQSIDLRDLYGDKGGEIIPAPTGTEPTKPPVDLSDLYGDKGGLVAPPPDARADAPGK